MKYREAPDNSISPTGPYPHAHPTQPSAVHRNYYYVFLQLMAAAASAPGGLILAVMICSPGPPDLRVAAYPETSSSPKGPRKVINFQFVQLLFYYEDGSDNFQTLHMLKLKTGDVSLF